MTFWSEGSRWVWHSRPWSPQRIDFRWDEWRGNALSSLGSTLLSILFGSRTFFLSVSESEAFGWGSSVRGWSKGSTSGREVDRVCRFLEESGVLNSEGYFRLGKRYVLVPSFPLRNWDLPRSGSVQIYWKLFWSVFHNKSRTLLPISAANWSFRQALSELSNEQYFEWRHSWWFPKFLLSELKVCSHRVTATINHWNTGQEDWHQ